MALSDHLGRLNLAPGAEMTLTDPTKMDLDEQSTLPTAVQSTEPLGSLGLDSHPKYGYAESFASYATSVNFSPCLASSTTHSGPMSPCHLSQPETPIMSDFEDEFLPPLRGPDSLASVRRSTSSDLDLCANHSPTAAPPHPPRPPQASVAQASHAPPGGFQGYSLPDHDHASVLTIRKLPSLTSTQLDGRAPPLAQQSSKRDLVTSWNDGSQHRVSALGDLVDDLGYLGHVII